MRKSRSMIVLFITPAVLSFLIMFLYPVIRTVVMSFFQMESVTADISQWTFTGFDNFLSLVDSLTFRAAIKNIGVIWLAGGAIVLFTSLLLAVVLTSGMKGKSFFRATIYLPNIVSAVALATMWKQYVFVNKNYGLMKGTFKALGLESLRAINWLGTDMLFWSMLIAFCFGAVGYYMLIFLSGIERIPSDLFEAATIDGANKPRQFFHITLPLLKGVFKTNLTFWSINSVTFFVWTKMFSPQNTELSTVTPMVQMYDITFGSRGNTLRNAGAGAAIGVVMAACVLLIFLAINKLIHDDGIEF